MCARASAFSLSNWVLDESPLLFGAQYKHQIWRRENLYCILDSQHVKSKASLHWVILNKLFKITCDASFHFDNKANTLAVRFVTNSYNTFDTFFLNQTHNMFMDFGFGHVWKFSVTTIRSWPVLVSSISVRGASTIDPLPVSWKPYEYLISPCKGTQLGRTRKNFH